MGLGDATRYADNTTMMVRKVPKYVIFGNLFDHWSSISDPLTIKIGRGRYWVLLDAPSTGFVIKVSGGNVC